MCTMRGEKSPDGPRFAGGTLPFETGPFRCWCVKTRLSKKRLADDKPHGVGPVQCTQSGKRRFSRSVGASLRPASQGWRLLGHPSDINTHQCHLNPSDSLGTEIYPQDETDGGQRFMVNVWPSRFSVEPCKVDSGGFRMCCGISRPCWEIPQRRQTMPIGLRVFRFNILSAHKLSACKSPA